MGCQLQCWLHISLFNKCKLSKRTLRGVIKHDEDGVDVVLPTLTKKKEHLPTFSCIHPLHEHHCPRVVSVRITPDPQI